MSDPLTLAFREKVNTINPLNKKELSKEIGVDYDRMNKWLTGGINIKSSEDRTAVKGWLDGTSKKTSKKDDSDESQDATSLQAIREIATANKLLAQSNKDLTDMLKEERHKRNPTDQEDKRKHLAVLTRIAAMEEFLLERLSKVEGIDIEELSEAFDTKFDTLAKRNIGQADTGPASDK